MPRKPTAEYDIRANDESPAGWRQAIQTAAVNVGRLNATVNKGFGDVERSFQASIRRMNAGFALLGGAGFATGLRAVLRETAEQSVEFASALDEVKDSWENLFAVKDTTFATEALSDLAEVLQDPATIQAAEALTSTLIRGFAGGTQFVTQFTVGMQAALGLTGDEIEELNSKITAIEGRIERAKARGLPATELQAQRERLVQQQLAALDRGKPDRAVAVRFRLDPSGFTLPNFRVPDLAIDTSKELQDFSDLEGARRLRAELEEMGEMRRDLFAVLDKGIADGITATSKDAGAAIDQVGDSLQRTIEKARASSTFVDEMQRDLFSNVSGLLASAGDGAEEFGDRMIGTFKRVLADKATLELFEYFAGLGSSLSSKSGGKGFLGFLGSGLTSLFGGFKADGGPLQQGKWYIAGEHGREPIWGGGSGAFAMGYGGAAGAISVHVTNYFNNLRDVSDAKMAAASEQIANVVEARIRDKRRRGQF